MGRSWILCPIHAGLRHCFCGNIVTTLQADEALNARLGSIRAQIDPNVVAIMNLDVLSATDLQQSALAHLLELNINGSAEMKEQKVVVEYLRNDQRLMIPTALGMTLTAAVIGRAPNHAVLLDRYVRTIGMTYQEIRNLVVPLTTAAAVQTAVGERPIPAALALRVDWNATQWYVIDGADQDSPAINDVVMATFSQCLQFNCDIRDYGILNREDMHVSDSAWANITEVPFDRLNNKLKPYSLQSIAALNVNYAGGCALAAWVRAYGVGMGLLPSANSKCIKEFTFTALTAPAESRTKVIDYDKEFERPLITLCANILAMFGLFHLNKDHTYRTNDSNMERIGISYVNTLRTDTTTATIEYMKQNQEAIVHTRPHPFGLAQPYWLARVMDKFERLMAPLAVRIDTTPPPVHRVIICDVTAQEWEALPVGQYVSALYTDSLALIRDYVMTIRASPPSFSSLATLYGCTEQTDVPANVKAAVIAMMPCVSGYITATHTDGPNMKDGVGYALSLQNVQRDSKGLVLAWTAAWEKYMSGLDQMNVMEFVTAMEMSRKRAEETLLRRGG